MRNCKEAGGEVAIPETVRKHLDHPLSSNTVGAAANFLAVTLFPPSVAEFLTESCT